MLAHFNLFNREVILYKFGAIARRTKIEHAILRLYVIKKLTPETTLLRLKQLDY